MKIYQYAARAHRETRAGFLVCEKTFNSKDGVQLQIALLTGAAGISVAHNHPSGSTTPSQADIETTERIQKACDILGITLLDHIIVSYKGYGSLREQGFVRV